MTPNPPRKRRRAWDADLAHWVANLGDALADRPADHGLIERRVAASLGPFTDAYIESREDAAPNTIRNWRNTQGKLVAFFRPDRGLRDISKGDADDWRQSLVNHGYAQATLSKAIKGAKPTPPTATCEPSSAAYCGGPVLNPGSGCFKTCEPAGKPNWPTSSRFT